VNSFAERLPESVIERHQVKRRYFQLGRRPYQITLYIYNHITFTLEIGRFELSINWWFKGARLKRNPEPCKPRQHP